MAHWKVSYWQVQELIRDIEFRRTQKICHSFFSHNNPDDPFEISENWISRRGTTWIQTKSAGMFIPTNANHLMLTTYVRNFESMACKDWNQAVPNYAQVMATHRINKQQKVFRVEIELAEISGIPQKYLCRKGRSLHDLDLSRQHGLPYTENTKGTPCHFCQSRNEARFCTRCFKPFGFRDSGIKATQDRHVDVDNHDCWMAALKEQAKQDTPQGAIAALHLTKYTPFIPIPPKEVRKEKPTDDQIKRAAEVLLDPMIIEQQNFQKQAALAAQARALSRKADREAQSKQQPDAFQPVRKTSKKSLNPALQMFNFPKSAHSREQRNIHTQSGPSHSLPEHMEAGGPSQPLPSQMDEDNSDDL